MYGMVNKAIEQMVVKLGGEPAWESIKSNAGVETEVFISNDAYDDAITYQLVDAASKFFNLPTETVLHNFGRHWVLCTAREDYGELLLIHGRTLRQFLVNLPDFHTRVQMIFPNLRPPRFEISDLSERSLHLHYYTHRPGLAAFVTGLLDGLGELFNTQVSVRHISQRARGEDHDVFDINWI